MFCATRYGANQSTVLVILTCLLIGLSYPASTSIPATVTTGAFGGREYAKICSYLMAALYFGKAIVSPVLSGIKAASGGLMGGFIALFAIAIAVLGLVELGLMCAPMHKLTHAQRLELERLEREVSPD